MLHVPEEMPLAIHVNGRELVTILCSPSDLEYMVIGYLFSEGLIQSMEDIAVLNVCESAHTAEVVLKNDGMPNWGKRILTSGFGGGVSLGGESPRVSIRSDLAITSEKVFTLVRKMIECGSGYRLTGGVHTTVLCDENTILAIGEDIGRHNTLDKVLGRCLVKKIPTKDKILMTTGRIASEILKKALRLEVPVVVSLSSPTSEAIHLARSIGVTLIGYVRDTRMIVYAAPQRLESSMEMEGTT